MSGAPASTESLLINALSVIQDPGLASYTFSHSIDNASTDALATYFKLAGRDWFEGMVSFWPDRLRRLTSKPMLGCSGSFASPRRSGFVRAEFFNILNHPDWRTTLDPVGA